MKIYRVLTLKAIKKIPKIHKVGTRYYLDSSLKSGYLFSNNERDHSFLGKLVKENSMGRMDKTYTWVDTIDGKYRAGAFPKWALVEIKNTIFQKL